MPTVTTRDGTQIFYKDWGTSRPVVYPHLQAQDVRQALQYAATLANEETGPLGPPVGVKLLADMGVSMTTVAALRANGHDVKHLRDEGLHKLPDTIYRYSFPNPADYHSLRLIQSTSIPAVALDARGEPHRVRAFSVHPGAVMTELVRSMPEEELRAVLAASPSEVYKTTEQRAATSVWCAMSPQLDGMGGVYCEDVDIATAVPADDPEARGREAVGDGSGPRRAPVEGERGVDRGDVHRVTPRARAIDAASASSASSW